MSTIVIGGNSFADLSMPDLSGTWAGSQSVYHSDVVDVIQQGDGNFVFEGTGLGDLDAHGYAQTGTVTQFSFYGSDFNVVVSDFSIDAVELWDIFRHAKNNAFNDFLFGGDDDITLNPGGARIFTGDGDDHVTGGKGSDHVAGQDGSDTISGGKGEDFVGGGKDADTLTGGGSADHFAYAALSDSRKGGIDTITDLQNQDFIDLSAIDADTVAPGEQGFFISDSHHGVPGELVLTYDAVNDRTIIRGYTDTDNKADLIIYATGDHSAYVNFDF